MHLLPSVREERHISDFFLTYTMNCAMRLVSTVALSAFTAACGFLLSIGFRLCTRAHAAQPTDPAAQIPCSKFTCAVSRGRVNGSRLGTKERARDPDDTSDQRPVLVLLRDQNSKLKKSCVVFEETTNDLHGANLVPKTQTTKSSEVTPLANPREQR